ncbi:MAG: hypothetical protein JNG82_04035 [Opitutaceae bacterium]|nr:hypothetical protein [Opitutaceae bacterium]
MDHLERNVPPPALTITFSGGGPCPELKASNCGVFTTPVIISALVDIRKFASFFGIYVDKNGALVSRPKSRTDDFDISDVGLPYPMVVQFLSIMEPEGVTDAKFQNAIASCLTYSNKEVAHFTLNKLELYFNPLILASFGIDRAMRILVFDPLGIAHPDLRIKEIAVERPTGGA